MERINQQVSGGRWKSSEETIQVTLLNINNNILVTYVRMVSHLFSESSNEKSEGIRCNEKTNDSFQNLFGPIELRTMKPVQLTLFYRDMKECSKKSVTKPHSVSPLTGHVLGVEGFHVIESPRRKGINIKLFKLSIYMNSFQADKQSEDVILHFGDLYS